MKKLFFASFLFLGSVLSVSAQSQWTGTNPLITSSDIRIGQGQTNSYLKVNSANHEWWTGVGHIGGDGRFVIYDQTLNAQRFTIGTDGNVGIGTLPLSGAKLEVAGTIKNSSDILMGGSQANSYLKVNTANQEWWAGVGVNSGDGKFVVYDRTADKCRLIIEKNGYVGIGTGTAVSADAMLTVNGTIHAKQVNIDLTGSLADFVFKKDYKLMDLKEVENFVNKNSHLPEIPSASEVAANGMNIGEMQNKMLQKIEELTLYVIQQQKEIDELKKK